jgi:uncharacterized protein (DUF1800 family)
MNIQRLETSRLLHRFGYGPRPGEYAQALIDGVAATRSKVLAVPAVEAGAAKVVEPEITDLGPRPKPNTAEIVPFAIAMRYQTQQLVVWWLDRMAASDHGLTEKMTWFWHGHWATSVDKLNYPLPMFKQNKTLRATCLGNFATMTKAMINDGALQFWLDGQDNTAKAPNENLGRELMELFTLGVGRYTEDDVKNISRVLTGYQVNRSSGVVTINQNRRDKNPVNLLGTTAVFTGDSLAEFLVARDDSAKFISERLWYRFVSSTEEMPANYSVKNAFSGRDIAAAVSALANDSTMRDEKYAMVKSPVECGWPAGEAWLSSATAQYRISFATWLIKQSELRVLKSLTPAQRILQSADWLGVAEWSPRTKNALRDAQADPAQFALLALCSPEYLVSA